MSTAGVTGLIIVFILVILLLFMIQRQLIKKAANQAIIENNARIFALEDNFESLYDVEIESGHYISYVKGDFYQNTVIDKLVTPTDYFEDLRANIDAVIYPEDRDALYNALTRESIRRELEENDHFDHFYRINTESGPIWFKMRVVYKDETKESVIIGAFNAANDVEAKQIAEQRAMLQESLTFTNFFLDTYVSAYYVNFDTFACQTYKRTAELEKDYPIINNYFESLVEYINNDVHPDDREDLLNIVEPEKMRAYLKLHPNFTHIFRDISGGVEKTYRMQAIRGAEENRAAFGFMDITSEVEAQKERHKEAENSAKLIQSIATAYAVSFALNMTDNTFRPIRVDKSVAGKFDSFDSFEEAKDSLMKILHETDKERMLNELDFETIKKKLDEKKSYNVEYRTVIDGVTKWHEMNVTYIDEDEIAMGFSEKDEDITKLRLEQKRYEENFALFVVDIDTEMLKVLKNSQGYRKLKIGDSVPYAPAIRGLADGLNEEAQEFFNLISNMEFIKSEFAEDDKRTFSYKSNKLSGDKWVDVTSYVILRHEDGSPAMFTIGFSIVDALAAVSREIKRKLEEAYDAAELASKSKSNFLFNMSHDIRTPMNAITGFTSMAKKYIDDKDKVKDYLDKIDTSGQQLLILINQVLEMARIESGKIELEERPVDIKASYESVTTVFREQANVNGLNFSSSIENIEHNNVLVDEARMSSIILNIVSNALKYTPKGGSVDYNFREIPCNRAGYARYVFTVSDTGIGMSEEYQRKLFQPFERERSSTVSNIQGTGLGLSIVKNLIELMDGTIEVESKLGEGSRFTLTFDFKINETADKSDEKGVKTETASFEGKRALLVEDNEMNREIARDILEDLGLIIEEAEDGDVAVAMIKDYFDSGDEDHFDLVFMDIQMPRMNGYEAAKAIRNLPPLEHHVPIIAMTANAFEEDRQNAFKAGMDEHLAKPIDIGKLKEALAKFI